MTPIGSIRTTNPLQVNTLRHDAPKPEVLEIDPAQIGFDYYRDLPDANSKTAYCWLYDVNENYKVTIKNLLSLRHHTYEEDGSLKQGMTTPDHYQYLRELKKVAETNVLINRLVARYPEHAGVINQPHHSTSVYGDIQAALNQNPVPDFNYNRGTCQFG